MSQPQSGLAIDVACNGEMEPFDGIGLGADAQITR